MKLTFIETPVFTELITGLLSDEDYRRLQEYLLMYPTGGDVIVSTARVSEAQVACIGPQRRKEWRHEGDLLLPCST